MEYSLNTLNNNTKLSKLSLTSVVDKLNLIGFEVDDIFIKELKSNRHCNTIKLLLKIPSNREDLMIQFLLEKELKTIFSLEFYQLWENLKKDYSFVLKRIFLKHDKFKTIFINSDSQALVYYKIKIKNYRDLKTPLWIKHKLENNGLASFNLMSDLLSLVNFEYGSTLNILKDQTNKNLHLKKTDKTELFTDINNNFVEVPEGSLVLKGNDTILSVLGYTVQHIIKSESDFELEYVYYDIHKNILNLNTVNTKLSLRFLRKTYLENSKKGFERLLTLLEITTPFEIEKEVSILNYQKISLESSKILRLKKLKLQNILNLKNLNLKVFEIAGLKIICETLTELYFSVPLFRNDLQREIDIIEEYSRFSGYKHFKQIKPIKNLVFSKSNRNNIEYLKNHLLSHNFFEVFTNSLIDKNSIENCSVTLTNPLNNELAVLRNNLISNLVSIFETNLRSKSVQKKFFEIGRVFKISNKKIIEQDKIAAIFQLDKTNNPDLDWFHAKGFLENLLRSFGYSDYKFEKLITDNTVYHPTRSIVIKINDNILGQFGELHPEFKKEILTKTPIYSFELNLIYFKSWQLNSKIKIYNDSSKYPQITKDLSFFISKKTNITKIKEIIKTILPNLKDVSFFDLYFDKENNNKTSVALNLQFQSKTSTLINENIEKEIEFLKEKLINEFGIQFKT